MKTEVVQTKTISFNDLNNGDSIGFIDQYGKKGLVVHIANDRYMAISSQQYSHAICNSTYGEEFSNSIEQALNTDRVCAVSLTHIYRFDTRKELYQWLAE